MKPLAWLLKKKEKYEYHRTPEKQINKKLKDYSRLKENKKLWEPKDG